MKKKERRRRTFLLETWVTEVATLNWVHIGITDGQIFIDGKVKYKIPDAADIGGDEEEKENNGRIIH